MKTRVVIVSFVLCQLLAQSTESEKDEKLRLVHADVLRGQMDGEKIRQFIGNVKFEQGDAVLTCERAMEYEDVGRFVLIGDVAFIDSSKSLFGDKITYYDATKIAYLEGHVKLVDSTKTVVADRIRYHDEQEEAYADGNVILIDAKENIDILGDHAEYFRTSGYARVTGHAMLTKSDSTDDGELIITGKIFQMFDDGERFLVTDSVKVDRGDLEAFCDSLEYFQAESLIKLANAPRVQQGRQYLTGHSVSLLLQEADVKVIHIVGNAIASSAVDSTVVTPVPFDLLSGQDMMVYVTDEKIDSVLIKERATSYYHVVEDGEEKGLNKALGDLLFIRFKEDTLSRVRVTSSPGSSVGQFHPPTHRAVLEAELRTELAKLNIYVDEPAAPWDSTGKMIQPAAEAE
ncbi:hypothetical protein JXA02_08730 [candidate division KSB1 bacterium]|nr:hypothetical protein [candidate division KSB1 bacterium]RQW05081.1 MAG: hypothetical protein EH222_10310 [candidate division KSB1 bacterium]